MKRIYLHSGFAAIACASAIFALSQWLELRDRQAINKNVKQALSQTKDALDANNFDPARINTEMEVALAHSSVLLKHGEFAKAQELLSQIAQNKTQPKGVAVARFNMANAYLREAISNNENIERKVPLIELAKQRYRDLLKEDPGHWDARHNLELALRLAPEKSEFDIDKRGKPIKSVSVIFPGFEDRDLP